MKKTIYNANFEESQRIVNDDYIIKTIEESSPTRIKKRVFGLVVMSLIVIGTYYFSKFINDGNPNSIKFYSVKLKNIWLLWGFLGIFLSFFIYFKSWKKKFGFSKDYLTIFVFLLVGLLLQAFSMGFSLVHWKSNSIILPVVYCILLVLFPAILNNKINIKLYNALYEKEKGYSNKFAKFTEIFEKWSKKYAGLLFLAIVIFKYIQSKLGLTIQENGIIDTALMLLSPLVFVAGAGFMVGFKEDIMQGFYLSKYYEEYRQKFGFSVEEWYGRHSKMYKNQVKEQRKN